MKLRKIGKKGDTTVEPIVVLSVAVIVLVIVGFGFYLHFSERINFFRLLPDFNLTEGKQEAIQIVSYNIVEDKIEYFDGENWVELKESVDLGGKRVDGDFLRRDLVENYWYGRGLIGMEFLVDASFYRVDNLGIFGSGDSKAVLLGIVFVDGSGQKAGDMNLGLLNSEEKNVGGYLINAEGVFRNDPGPQLSQDLKQTIRNYFVNLRIVIREGPAEIFYYGAQDEGLKNQISKKFCVEKKNDRLIVRLDEPTSREECDV